MGAGWLPLVGADGSSKPPRTLVGVPSTAVLEPEMRFESSTHGGRAGNAGDHAGGAIPPEYLWEVQLVLLGGRRGAGPEASAIRGLFQEGSKDGLPPSGFFGDSAGKLAIKDSRFQDQAIRGDK